MDFLLEEVILRKMKFENVRGNEKGCSFLRLWEREKSVIVA